MLGVEIRGLNDHGQDVSEGVILLIGNRLVTSNDSPGLVQILKNPTAGPPSGWKPVTAESDPRLFLECLRYRYYSAYGRASAPREFD